MQRLAQLRARVSSDPWDADAWGALLIGACTDQQPVDKSMLADAAERFPTVGRVWKARAEAATASGDHSAARALFTEGLKFAPVSVELWRAYASWVAERASDPGVGGPMDDASGSVDAPESPEKVFEAAVSAAGLDLGASPLWGDYVAWAQSQQHWPDSQRRDVLRKIYQRAVRMPMRDVDAFWTEYRQFEETANTNKELGRGLLADAQPRYVAARAEFRARRIRREGLALSAFPVPPRGRQKDALQAAQWRRFLATERLNPHILDRTALHARVVHAFETALVPMYRYPDFWIEYLSYIADTVAARLSVPNIAPQSTSATAGDGETATLDDLESIAARATTALPDCVVLYHHVSCLWMRAGKPQMALAILDSLVKASPSHLAYVHLMRLTRKVSGKDAARKIFAKARRDTAGAAPAVYIAAAQMEFIVNKDNKIARNVFEFGLKHYPSSVLMVREFVEWLWGLGDFDHLRVVLKRVMPTVEGTPDLVRTLWERWIELEDAVGDVASVQAVEAAWRESGTSRTESVVADAVRRCRFLGQDGMREEELAVIGLAGAVGGGMTTTGGSGGSGNGGASGNTGIGGSVSIVSGGNSSSVGVGAASGAGCGGKRDPRTGRRVGGVNSNGGAGDATKPMHGRGAGSGSNSAGELPGGKRALSSGADVVSFEEIEINVRRMAAGMQTIPAPPPDFDTIAQLIMKTPDSFAATPAGGGVGIDSDAGKAGGAKKRSGDEMMAGDSTTQQQQQKLPPQDLFRARQAAKQSRMR
jgi:cleavage stimulation factor subunit 3